MGLNITSNFEFTQGVASAVWNINHNLDKYPSIMVVDSGGTVVVGQEQYIDKNNIVITFAAPFSGKAYLT
jgi:hypothetical protein